MIFADFLSCSNPGLSNAQRALVPPQPIHWWSERACFCWAPINWGGICTLKSLLEYAPRLASDLRLSQSAAGRDTGRSVGLLRGWSGSVDPARDRNSPRDSHHPAVNGPRRGNSGRLGVTAVYFAITLIISLIEWTELARPEASAGTCWRELPPVAWSERPRVIPEIL